MKLTFLFLQLYRTQDYNEEKYSEPFGQDYLSQVGQLHLSRG